MTSVPREKLRTPAAVDFVVIRVVYATIVLGLLVLIKTDFPRFYFSEITISTEHAICNMTSDENTGPGYTIALDNCTELLSTFKATRGSEICFCHFLT